jgi:broad specificity phosphatase PhoE
VRTIWLARHGQSVSNAVRRFQGVQDVALSDLGRRQAECLARAVHGRAIAHVYASPLERARETAVAAARALGAPLTVVDDLRELSLGEWEGRTVEEVRALPGDPYAQWVRDPLEKAPPGGESLADVQSRAVRVLEMIGQWHPNGDDVLVVSHGGVISAYLAYCLGLPLGAIWRLTVSNCSLTRVAPPVVVSINDTGHLAALDAPPGPPLSP